jgi:hypothetical protein
MRFWKAFYHSIVTFTLDGLRCTAAKPRRQAQRFVAILAEWPNICRLGISRSLPLYGGCHRRKPIVVGSQIIGGLHDMPAARTAKPC